MSNTFQLPREKNLSENYPKIVNYLQISLQKKVSLKITSRYQLSPDFPATKIYLKTTPMCHLSPDYPAKKIYLKTTPKCHISPDYPSKGSREIDYAFGVYGR